MAERRRGAFSRAVVAVVLAWLVGAFFNLPFRWWTEYAPGAPGPIGDPKFDFMAWPLFAIAAAWIAMIPLVLFGIPLVAWVLPRLTRNPVAGLAIGALAGTALIWLAVALGHPWRGGGWPVGAVYGGLCGLFGAWLARD